MRHVERDLVDMVCEANDDASDDDEEFFLNFGNKRLCV